MIFNGNKFKPVLTTALSELDTALIGRVVPVNDSGGSLACTDNKKIEINLSQLSEIITGDAEYLTALKGLNIHEVGHIEITRYKFDDWYEVVPYQEFHHVLNLLEDIRLENYLIKKYPFSVKYLNTAFSLIILPGLLDADAETLSRKNKALMYARLIGTDYVREDARYKEITEKIAGYFKEEFKKDGEMLVNHVKTYINNDNVNVLINTAKKVYNIINNSGEEDKKPEDTEPDGDKDGGKSGDKDGGKSGDKDGGRIKAIIENLLKELQKNKSKELSGDISTQKELKEIEDKINNGGYTETPEIKNGITTLKHDILKLKNKPVKRFIREQIKGKFSVRDYLKNKDSSRNFNKVFNKKETSQPDALNMSVCLCVDSSGSMHSINHKLQYDTAYLIARGLEETKNRVQVIEFSGNCPGAGERFAHKYTPETSYKTIKPFNTPIKKADLTRHFGEGNEIVPPLNQALRDLSGENTRNKYVIIITDGGLIGKEQDGNEEGDVINAVQKLNKAGIPVYALIVSREKEYGIFNKEIHLNNFAGVNEVLKKLILDIQRDIIAKSRN